MWTNEEGGDNGNVTTGTFDEQEDGRTLLVMSERYPSKEELDAEGGAADATHETFAQLDGLLVTLH